ncbi:MAG: DUF2061 domain-containing protein [Flavobacteriaceae bacterium]
MIADQFILNTKKEKTSFKKDKNSERPIRSIAKAVSWRVVGTVDTLVISYFFVDEVMLAASIASADFVTKMVLYFFHERIWNGVNWGK